MARMAPPRHLKGSEPAGTKAGVPRFVRTIRYNNWLLGRGDGSWLSAKPCDDTPVMIARRSPALRRVFSNPFEWRKHLQAFVNDPPDSEDAYARRATKEWLQCVATRV